MRLLALLRRKNKQRFIVEAVLLLVFIGKKFLFYWIVWLFIKLLKHQRLPYGERNKFYNGVILKP